MEYKIEIEKKPKQQDVAIIHEGLDSHNISVVGDAEYKKLSIFIRDESGVVIGGLLGVTYWGWLFISDLWVDHKLRQKGYATRLMAAAEAEALARGCKRSYLDTFSFQARPLYVGLGYEVFGVLEDFPGEHKRFFMKKTLTPDTSYTAC